MVDFRRNTAIVGGMLAFSLLALTQAPAQAGDAIDHLTDVHGRAVYVLSGAACYGYCAMLWPSVPAGAVRALSPAKARLVGAEALPGGTSGATYAGKPLHYFAEDVLPGDMKAIAPRNSAPSAIWSVRRAGRSAGAWLQFPTPPTKPVAAPTFRSRLRRVSPRRLRGRLRRWCAARPCTTLQAGSRWRHRPMMRKPYTADEIRLLVEQLLSG